jgi:hypothetical protein
LLTIYFKSQVLINDDIHKLTNYTKYKYKPKNRVNTSKINNEFYLNNITRNNNKTELNDIENIKNES